MTKQKNPANLPSLFSINHIVTLDPHPVTKKLTPNPPNLLSQLFKHCQDCGFQAAGLCQLGEKEHGGSSLLLLVSLLVIFSQLAKTPFAMQSFIGSMSSSFLATRAISKRPKLELYSAILLVFFFSKSECGPGSEFSNFRILSPHYRVLATVL